MGDSRTRQPGLGIKLNSLVLSGHHSLSTTNVRSVNVLMLAGNQKTRCRGC